MYKQEAVLGGLGDLCVVLGAVHQAGLSVWGQKKTDGNIVGNRRLLVQTKQDFGLSFQLQIVQTAHQAALEVLFGLIA